jgi:GMP synthase (glutamine-hydrolysing)
MFDSSCFDFDFLVVMGGPQSPATTKQECPHYDAQKEIALIKKAVAEGKIAFGVCLGAQLIGEALGASFDHSPNREIGVFPITLTEEGKKDPLIGSWPQTFDTGHWHGDMPGLTNDAKILAFSEGCPRQIVRYTSKVYGFQCHFEFTPEAIEAMIKHSTEELTEHAGKPFVETPDQLRKHDFTEINAKLFGFLDNLTA